MKNNKKKGFTLMELLIVIAIIVVLVAIAIPVFGGQLTKAKETTDVANVRSWYAEAQTKILSGESTASAQKDAIMGKKDQLNYPDNLKNPSGTQIKYDATKIDDQTWNLGDVQIS